MKQLEQFFHKHIIKFTLIVTLPLWAAFAFAEDFDYVETNTWIKHSESGYSFGTRQHIDKDTQQYMVRKDFKDTPYRLEYRSIHKGQSQEHWLRAQIKGFTHAKAFSINHRIEHRVRENRDNIFRYRPTFEYTPAYLTVLGGNPFVTLEPHWQYTYSSGDAGYSHLQTYVGLEYKVYEKFTVVPYIEIDYNTSFTKDNAFFIVDFKFKL